MYATVYYNRVFRIRLGNYCLAISHSPEWNTFLTPKCRIGSLAKADNKIMFIFLMASHSNSQGLNLFTRKEALEENYPWCEGEWIVFMSLSKKPRITVIGESTSHRPFWAGDNIPLRSSNFPLPEVNGIIFCWQRKKKKKKANHKFFVLHSTSILCKEPLVKTC